MKLLGYNKYLNDQKSRDKNNTKQYHKKNIRSNIIYSLVDLLKILGYIIIIILISLGATYLVNNILDFKIII